MDVISVPADLNHQTIFVKFSVYPMKYADDDVSVW